MHGNVGLLVGRLVHYFGPGRNISTIIGRITMEFCSDIPRRMNPTLVDLSDPL